MAKLDTSTPLLDERSEYIQDFSGLKTKMVQTLEAVQLFQKEAEALETKMTDAGADNAELREIQKLTKWFKSIKEL